MAIRNLPLRLRGEREQAILNRLFSRTVLNDSREAAVIRNVAAAAAAGDELLSFSILALLDLFSIDNAIREDLDERAVDYGTESSSELAPRSDGKRAQGNLEFTRTGISGTINIPVGTRVEKPGSTRIVAVTTVAGTIPAGSTTSGLIAATTEQVGAAANGEPGTFKKLVSRIPGVNAVTNPTPFVGGEDEERDADFRERIKNYVRTLPLCTPKAIEELAVQVELEDGRRVVSAKAIERADQPGRATLYIDDGTGTVAAGASAAIVGELLVESATGQERRLQLDRFPVNDSASVQIRVNSILQVRDTDYFLMPGTGAVHLSEASYPTGLAAGDTVTADYTYFTGLIAETQWRLDGRQENRSLYPGWRALGAHILVKAPTTNFIDVEARLVLRTGYVRDTAVSRAKAEVSRYVNSLEIGADVILHELVERLMGVPGVFDLRFTEPTGNIAIADDAVARVQDSGLMIE